MRLTMTPEQLSETLAALDLEVAEAAAALGVSARAVYTWLDGTRAIPGPAVAALACMGKLRRGKPSRASSPADTRPAAGAAPTTGQQRAAPGGQDG